MDSPKLKNKQLKITSFTSTGSSTCSEKLVVEKNPTFVVHLDSSLEYSTGLPSTAQVSSDHASLVEDSLIDLYAGNSNLGSNIIGAPEGINFDTNTNETYNAENQTHGQTTTH